MISVKLWVKRRDACDVFTRPRIDRARNTRAAHMGPARGGSVSVDPLRAPSTLSLSPLRPLLASLQAALQATLCRNGVELRIELTVLRHLVRVGVRVSVGVRVRGRG